MEEVSLVYPCELCGSASRWLQYFCFSLQNLHPRSLLMTKLQVKERPKLSCDVWTSNSQIICESAQTRLHIKSPPYLFIKKSVLSLARPNFLTGAIIQTRFQASLLAPPDCIILNSKPSLRVLHYSPGACVMPWEFREESKPLF